MTLLNLASAFVALHPAKSGRRARVLLSITAASVAFGSATAMADPSNGGEAAFYYSQRPNPSGDISEALTKPNLYTGSMGLSVPIEVPRGTGGLTPSLALSYNSGAGRGDAGVGWNLDLPKIVRSTKYGANVQTWTNAQATWVLDGNELVASNSHELDPYNCFATRYYSTSDRFQKILYCQRAVPNDYWVVFEKDGTQRRFGWLSEAKLYAGANTYEYLLSEVRDVHGQTWQANYRPYGLPPSHASAPVLSDVQYTFYSGAPVGGPAAQRSIVLSWQTTSGAAPAVDWRYGFAVVHDQQRLLDAGRRGPGRKY